MARVNSKERFLDIGARKKFGFAWQYGEKIYGQHYYGNEEVEWDYNEFGFGIFGITVFGSDDKRWGIYQKRIENGEVFYIKEKFYIPSNPQSVPQQAHRQKYGEAVGAWRNLTAEQKEVYNKRAVGKKFSGYNLFVKEYLNSH